MRRDQLEHAIRASCQIIQHGEVIVVGSQAILGTFDESQLPAAATMSLEVDILPIAETNEETARLADLIEGVAGEFSTFEDLHGFSIDGVFLTQSLPQMVRRRSLRRVITTSPIRATQSSESDTAAPAVPRSAWARRLSSRTSSRVGASMRQSRPPARSRAQALNTASAQVTVSPTWTRSWSR